MLAPSTRRRISALRVAAGLAGPVGLVVAVLLLGSFNNAGGGGGGGGGGGDVKASVAVLQKLDLEIKATPVLVSKRAARQLVEISLPSAAAQDKIPTQTNFPANLAHAEDLNGGGTDDQGDNIAAEETHTKLNLGDGANVAVVVESKTLPSPVATHTIDNANVIHEEKDGGIDVDATQVLDTVVDRVVMADESKEAAQDNIKHNSAASTLAEDVLPAAQKRVWRIADTRECGRDNNNTDLSGDCRCAALYSGPDCTSLAPTCSSSTSSPSQCPGAYTSAMGDFVLNRAGVRRTRARTGSWNLKVYLPGKAVVERSIMPLGSKALSPSALVAALPKVDPLRVLSKQGPLASCAVVGSSGSLLMRRAGAEIDAHDAVIRFNGAGVEEKWMDEHVGSKTTVRIVNSKWLDYRSSKEEIVVSHARSPKALTIYATRPRARRREKMFIFSPEFTSYLAAQGHTLSQHAHFDSLNTSQYTPTSGWTGMMLAMQLCSSVHLYGFHASAGSAPYHYHNRCVRPYGHRDSAEWLLVKGFVDAGLAAFAEPCNDECHEEGAACDACRENTVDPLRVDEGELEGVKARWRRLSRPDYCQLLLDERRAANVAAGREANDDVDAVWDGA